MTQWQPMVKKLDGPPAAPVVGERERLRRGRALFQEGRYDEALGEFEMLRAEQPASAQAWLGIGLVRRRQQQMDEALACFSEACRLDPLLPKAYVLEGQALLEQGQLDRAMLAFQSALNLDPKSVKAMTGFGQVLRRQQRYEEALTQLRAALRYDPRKVQPRLLIAEIYRERDETAAALNELRLVLEIAPGHVRAAIVLARLLLATGEPDAASEVLSAALARVAEGDAGAAAQLGRAALELQLYAVAEAALRTALQHEPERMSIRLRLVEALLASGQLAEAEHQAAELPQNSAIAPLVHKLLGDIHYKRQQFQLAVEQYRATVLHLPDHEQMLSDLESELAAGGDWEELAEELQPSVAGRVAAEARRLRQDRRHREPR